MIVHRILELLAKPPLGGELEGSGHVRSRGQARDCHVRGFLREAPRESRVDGLFEGCVVGLERLKNLLPVVAADLGRTDPAVREVSDLLVEAATQVGRQG